MTTKRALVASVAIAVACGGAPRRFPARAPLAVDPDMTPFTPRPRVYKSPQVWDTVDNLLFEPLTRVLAVRTAKRAPNATALDEVADSSWFQNRVEALARGELAAWARGPCDQPPPDPAGPWRVTGGKPDGANPGFLLEHASGRRFLFKLDGGATGERASIADVIGSRLYHAAGYHVPCNRVAVLDPATLAIKPGASAKDFIGDKIPFTPEVLAMAMQRGMPRADGKVRGGLSELLPGTPLGPWGDFGTRPDDPNDIIPHEDRRELRGSYVFAALLGHYDAREQNALDVWVETGPGGAGYVRHYILDFGDGLGSVSSRPRVSRRRGHAYELDWGVWFVDTFTLGLLPRPWRDPRYGPGGTTLAFFSADNFDPDHFRTAYPYGPFTRLTEADAAWGARILARMSPAALRAMLDEAQVTDRAVYDAALAALVGRRDKLLRRYLGRLSPLAEARVERRGDAPVLCVVDRWTQAGLDGGARRTVTARLDGAALRVDAGGDASEHCARLPSRRGAYRVVELTAPRGRPLRVHLADVGGTEQVVGLER